MRNKTIYLSIAVVICLCTLTVSCSKYKPPESTLKISKSLTHDEAVTILNNNISLPIIHENVIGPDELSETKADSNGIVFTNYYKLGEEIDRERALSLDHSLSYVGSERKRYFLKERYDPGLFKYHEFDRIMNHGQETDKMMCAKNGFRFFNFNIYPNTFFGLCLKDEEQSFAALLKLMENANILMWK